MNDRPRSRPLDNVQLSQKRAHAKSGQLANGDSVARVARRLCSRCLRSTLQERKLAKSSGPSLPAPYQGVDGDTGRTRGRIAPKNSSLFPVSAQSERLATSSFRIRSTFVHSAKRRPSLSAYCGALLSLCDASGTGRQATGENLSTPTVLGAGHSALHKLRD